MFGKWKFNTLAEQAFSNMPLSRRINYVENKTFINEFTIINNYITLRNRTVMSVGVTKRY